MTLTTKVGAGALFASTIASLGAAGGRHFRKEDAESIQQKTKISTLIADRYDYIILDSSVESNKDWDDNWNAYNSDNSEKDKDVFGLKGWARGNTQDLKDKLKQKCSLLTDKLILENDNESYDNFAKYCTRGVTIKEKADKLKLRVLSVEGNNGGQDWDIWTTKTSTKSGLRVELGVLEVSDHVNAYEVIKRCKAVTTINKKDPKYSNIFEAYKKVCTR